MREYPEIKGELMECAYSVLNDIAENLDDGCGEVSFSASFKVGCLEYYDHIL